jgi:hypothetical protein
MRHCRPILFAAVLALVSPGAVQAMCFVVGTNVETLGKVADDLGLVVVGVPVPQGTADNGTTQLTISAVLKTHPVLDGRKVVTIPRYIGTDDTTKAVPYLIFADVFKGQIDPYRGVPATPAVVDYVTGLMKLDRKDRAAVLRYCADHLGDKDRTVADDVFAEFMQSPDKVIGEVARKMSAKVLRRIVEDKQTPAERLGLYGFLLGNCGGDEDAKTLRGLLDRLVKEEQPPGLDGLFTGYALLKPAEGWTYLRAQMKDTGKEFPVRYSCVRAAQFFHDTRPDVVAEKDILAVMEMGIDQSDMADIPIELLRKWGCWKLTDRILALYGRKEFDVPILRRSIIKYALQCPGNEAAAFIAARRKTDAELVKDMEKLLRDEEEAARKKGESVAFRPLIPEATGTGRATSRAPRSAARRPPSAGSAA